MIRSSRRALNLTFRCSVRYSVIATLFFSFSALAESPTSGKKNSDRGFTIEEQVPVDFLPRNEKEPKSQIKTAYDKTCNEWKDLVKTALKEKVDLTDLKVSCGEPKSQDSLLREIVTQNGQNFYQEKHGRTVSFVGQISVKPKFTVDLVFDTVHDDPIYLRGGLAHVDLDKQVYTDHSFWKNSKLLCEQEKERARSEIEEGKGEVFYIACNPKQGAHLIVTGEKESAIVGYTPYIQLTVVVYPRKGKAIEAASTRIPSGGFYAPSLSWEGDFQAVAAAYNDFKEVRKKTRRDYLETYSKKGVYYIYTAFDSGETPIRREEWFNAGNRLASKTVFPVTVLYSQD